MSDAGASPKAILTTVAITVLAMLALLYGLNRPAGTPRQAARPAQPAPAAPPPPAAAPVADTSTEPAAAEDPVTPPAAPLSLEEIVSRSMPSVVRVETGDGFGSGFFVRSDTLVTNVHVVTTHPTVTVRFQDGSTQIAHVETTAPELDVAVLRLITPGVDRTALPTSSGARARPGQEVVVLGSPMGLQNTVTRGIVSAVRQVGPLTLVQTDAAINPGNSGGPVLDREGRVIGIATMGMRSAQGLSFAVAIDHAEALLEGRRPTASSETPLSTLNRAVAGSGTASDGHSEADARREAGARAFEETIGRLARQGDALDGRWQSFRKVCYQGAIAGAFDREWFAVFEARAMRGTVLPGCTNEFADLTRVAEAIRDGVAAADEAARQLDVYPGTRRDVLRRARLDYGGWNR